ncbi:hypothetical protein JKP88DRAFT_309020 [Tribonema minus]|uniref:RGS domain-containing protein n=1 Tax=Tribonema minus TaxID=303371 RepID=A0A835Z5Z7_9STRA|nr:hypothetical protein JKP88DRAFT_309020 [Tribonema minus]
MLIKPLAPVSVVRSAMTSCVEETAQVLPQPAAEQEHMTEGESAGDGGAEPAEEGVEEDTSGVGPVGADSFNVVLSEAAIADASIPPGADSAGTPRSIVSKRMSRRGARPASGILHVDGGPASMGLRSGLELTLASGAEGHLLQALLAYTDRTLCTESVEFVMDCVDFLQMPEDEWADGPKAKRRTEICNTYIKIGSDKEVNLGAKQRLECLRMVAAQEPACFTEAAAEIRHILISDVWPKFLHSPEYEEAMDPSPTSEALLSPRLRFQKEGAAAFNNMKGRFRYGARTGSRLAAAALAATSKSPLRSPPGSGSWTLTPPLSPPQQMLPSREQKEAATAAKAAKHELQTWLSDEITCDEALAVAGEVQAAGGEGGPDHERWHQAMRNLRHNRRPSRSPMSMGNRTMGHVFNFGEEGAAATSTSNTGMKRRGSWRKKLPFRWGSGGSNGSAEGFKTLARSSSSPGLFALDQAQNDIPQEPEIPVNEPKGKLGHSRRPSATATAKAGQEATSAGSSGHKRTNSNGSRRNSFRRLYGLMTLQSNSMEEDDRNGNSNSNSKKGDEQGAEGGAVVNPMSRGNGKNSNFKKFEQCKAPPHRPPNANL